MLNLTIAFSFPVSANLNVRKLHATAGTGLSKTPTAEIERSLSGSAVSSVSKVTYYLECARGERACPVQVKKFIMEKLEYIMKKVLGSLILV